MDNLSKLEALRSYKASARAGGGDEKMKAQHSAGKKTAKERFELLFDDGSFVETDSLLKNRNILTGDDCYADGVLSGYGTVDGRLVYSYCQDFTVLGGSLGEMNAKKIGKIYDMASKTGAPVVAMLDCAGIRLEDGLDALSSYGEVMKKAADISGVVPQIAMILGPCAGSLSYVPAVSDFVFTVDEISALYVSSKEVIEGATGQQDKLFPSAAFCAENGTADFRVKTEEECFSKVKALLSYLPSNYLEDSFADMSSDDINRVCGDIIKLIPDDTGTEFDMKDIIKSFADSLLFFETSEYHAKNMITGFIKLNGETVGVVANQPKELNGLIDIDGAKKAAEFVNFCDSFNISILTLVDCEGFKISLCQERRGLMKAIGKLGAAFSQATCPKVSVVVRKAYGGAYILMNSKQMGADFSYAFPTAVISATTPEIAMNMFYNDELKQAKDPIKKRGEIIEEYKNDVATPYAAAKRGYIDDVIDPQDIRPILVSAFDVLLTKRVAAGDKKHGSYPL